MAVTSATDESLDVDAVLRRAGDAVGEPVAAGEFAGDLELLLGCLRDEAFLSEDGARSAAGSIVASLTTQHRLARAAAAGGSEPAMPAPLIVTGIHRSGTTLLQNLLAEHPDVYAPRLWELMYPLDAASPASLAQRAASYVDEYERVAPGFRDIHPLDALRPEECHRLISPTFRSEIYGLRYRVPTYVAALPDRDHAAAYRFHRAALCAILRRRPPPTATRAVLLKCPFHLTHPAEVAATYPGARIVRLHRDPLVALASACSLTATIRRARSRRVDAFEIGAFWLERAVAAVDRLTTPAAAAFGGLPVLDVRYDDLARDPVRAVWHVCDFAGLSQTATAERLMRAWVVSSRRHAAGRHRYRLEDYGLRTAGVARRFAAYRERLQV